jgi:hypothetical protein
VQHHASSGEPDGSAEHDGNARGDAPVIEGSEQGNRGEHRQQEDADEEELPRSAAHEPDALGDARQSERVARHLSAAVPRRERGVGDEPDRREDRDEELSRGVTPDGAAPRP